MVVGTRRDSSKRDRDYEVTQNGRTANLSLTRRRLKWTDAT
jgi:hypothetical protein